MLNGDFTAITAVYTVVGVYLVFLNTIAHKNISMGPKIEALAYLEPKLLNGGFIAITAVLPPIQRFLPLWECI